MNDLLKIVIEAHGGLSNWERFNTISAHLKNGGITWSMKGHPDVMNDIDVTVNLKKQWASHYPFFKEDWRTVFRGNYVAIENVKGEVVEELSAPRDSFKGHTLETPWSRLQLVYFIGYAMWTYFNAPFNFALPGYEVTELEPWDESGETWRRLQVKFPEGVATHGAVQTFYVGADGLIRRHDYDVDVLAGAGAAHYLSDYVEVSGIKVATKRRVYARLENNVPLTPEPLLVSIDLSDIKFS